MCLKLVYWQFGRLTVWVYGSLTVYRTGTDSDTANLVGWTETDTDSGVLTYDYDIWLKGRRKHNSWQHE